MRDRWQLDRFGYSHERCGYSLLDSNYCFSLISNVDEPRNVQEAMDMSDAYSWMKAMDEEIFALKKNDTCDLVPLLEGGKPIGCNCVFKKKVGLDGSVGKHKARLVVKGYSQVEGIDYGEIFSLVAMLTSIQFLLSLAATYDLEVEHMDVKTTLIHGDLEEEIYMSQPK